MSQEIFISYRRKDTGGYAGRLYDYLKKEYGASNVLFDIEVDATVEELRTWVQRVVPESSVIIVLIGDQWIEDKLKRRRLEDEDDIVRLEIELALNNEIPIIPLLIDGANFPSNSDLPNTIKKICLYKGYEINNNFWKSKFEVLIHAITSVVKIHTPIINKGVKAWNFWRKQNESIIPNLEGANLAGKDLKNIDLSYSNLCNADLRNTNLYGANLCKADLTNARLQDANLEAVKADETIFAHAVLTKANFTRALLNKADFRHANLNEVDLTETSLERCLVYGVSVWDANLKYALQKDLLLDDPLSGNIILSVDSIQMAVVIHLLLTSGGVRNMIDTISSKSILILGSSNFETKIVLDTLREGFRKQNYIPLLFDFEKNKIRDYMETILLLANMSRFIVVDLTYPETVIHELHNIIPYLPSVPIIPICQATNESPFMFTDFYKYSSVLLPVISYKNVEELLKHLNENIIIRAEEKLKEIMNTKISEISDL